MKKYFRLWIGIIISIVFIYLVFRKTDIREIGRLILNAQWGYVLIAFILTTVALLLRSYRWQYFLSYHKQLPIMSLFEATCIGLTANNLLPFRLGDITQAYVLAKRNNLSKSLCFSTIVLERLCDLVFPLSVIILSSFIFFVPGNKLIFFILGLGLILFIMLILLKKQVSQIAIKIFGGTKIGEKVIRAIENFYSGFRILLGLKSIIIISVYTLSLWLLYSLVAYIVLLSVNINISFFKAIWVQVITSISVTIPSSPGYIGTWEFFAQSALGILKVNKTQALTFALLFHATQYFVINVLGIIMTMRTGLSFTEIEKTSAEEIGK